MSEPIPSSLDPKRFSFIFASYGTPFLFEDFVIRDYMFGESLTVSTAGGLKVFDAKTALESMHAIGASFSLKDVEGKIEIINGSREEAMTMRASLLESHDLTKEEVEGHFRVMARMCQAYAIFDIGFTDGIYQESLTDPAKGEVLKLLSASKNVLREGFDAVFFDKGGFLSTIVGLLERQFDVEGLSWYMKDEVLSLFDGKRVPAEEIENRRLAYAYYITKEKDIVFFSGRQALAVYDLFVNDDGKTGSSLKGTVAHGKGCKVVGQARIIERDYADEKATREANDRVRPGDILIAETTDPKLLPAFKRAGAVVTDVGGMLSHAAITARELDVPCIIGMKVATRAFKDGDLIEVDAENGIVRKLP